MNDLGQTVLQADLVYFDTCVLPPLPVGLDVASLIDKLEANNTIVSNRWSAFPWDPKEMTGHEDEVFANLTGVITAIVAASSEILQGISPRLRYKSRPKTDMDTIYERKPSKPDGYFVPFGQERRDGRLYWYQVGVPAEYKSDDNRADVISVSGVKVKTV